MDIFTGQLLPEKYRKGDNVETFIEECETFFNFAGIAKAKQETIVVCLLDRDLKDRYKAVDKAIVGYKDRLRKAFSRTSSLFEDLTEACRYRMKEDIPEVFFEKVEKLADKILKHDLSKEALTEALLLHCCDDVDIKKEVRLNKVKGIDEIKEKIKAVHDVKSVTEDVNVVRDQGMQNRPRSYRGAVIGYSKYGQNQTGVGRNTTEYAQGRKAVKCNNCEKVGHTSETCRQRKPIKCFGCGKEGHMIRNCSERRPIKCYGCGQQGHVRRNCPNIECKRCQDKGHSESECYTNLNGRRRQQNTGDNNYRGSGYNQQRYREREDRRQGNNRRFVNNIEEEYEESVTGSEHPKGNASTEVEPVGAIN
jgi:hypothetical protein